jgi:predicted transglutaminase-like cysteine proteinase
MVSVLKNGGILMRYIATLILAASIFSVAAAKADDMPKMKMKGKMNASVQKDAECKMDAAAKDAECTMEQKKEQMQKMKQKQMKKTEEMKKEAGKGSEQGQAMREEHSRKWWKFWGEKTTE